MSSKRSSKERLFEIIFESDTRSGKWFDLLLIICIILSVTAVMLESMASIRQEFRTAFQWLEWFFTALFTIEYVIRIYCVPNRMRYIFSFYGLVDLVSIAPTYLGLFVTDAHYLLVIRILRILRIFRILKLTRYMSQAKLLTDALYRSQEKVTVFFFSIFSLAIIFGATMYIVEGAENGFTNIPKSVYWVIVTITTVGYGDISPQTGLGQVIASFIMITGYSIIAIPTGIFAAELSQVIKQDKLARVCPGCKAAGHEAKANYCHDCGAKL